MMDIKYYRYKIETLKNNKESLFKEIELLKNEIKDTIKKKDIIEEGYYIVQKVAEQTQKKLEYGLSKLPSEALSSVYNIPYKFAIKFVPRRNKTEADLLFERNGELFIPGKRTGYGPVDIVTLALKLVVYKLKKPRLRNVLLLDEPFPSIDINVQDKVCQLLRDLARENNIQLIIITHNEKLINAADKCYRVKMENKKSYIKEI